MENVDKGPKRIIKIIPVSQPEQGNQASQTEASPVEETPSLNTLRKRQEKEPDKWA